MTTPPDFRALIADDAYAMSFQSLGQYRTALLAALNQPEPVRSTGLLHSNSKYGPWEPLGKGDKPKRYCRGLVQPEPVGPTNNELLGCMIQVARSVPDGQATGIVDWEEEAIAAARAVLARWGRPAIEPVPVSERPWEREEWCDVEGKCWFYWPEWVNDNGDVSILEPPSWEFRVPEAMEVYPFSLPHHALPVPTTD